MKFIHTGDIHWGMSPDSDKPWSRERSQAIKETFEEVIRFYYSMMGWDENGKPTEAALSNLGLGAFCDLM